MRGHEDNMLTLRPEQMEKFSEAALKRFEDRMVLFVQRFFPHRYGQIGEENVRGLIRSGISGSAAYNIWRECDVARYVTLMFSLRPDFDTHHETAWAKPLLTDPSLGTEERLSRLLERTLEVLEHTKDPA
jgi:hypothetical protein